MLPAQQNKQTSVNKNTAGNISINKRDKTTALNSYQQSTILLLVHFLNSTVSKMERQIVTEKS